MVKHFVLICDKKYPRASAPKLCCEGKNYILWDFKDFTKIAYMDSELEILKQYTLMDKLLMCLTGDDPVVIEYLVMLI